MLLSSSYRHASISTRVIISSSAPGRAVPCRADGAVPCNACSSLLGLCLATDTFEELSSIHLKVFSARERGIAQKGGTSAANLSTDAFPTEVFRGRMRNSRFCSPGSPHLGKSNP